jgi:hypothetical protein
MAAAGRPIKSELQKSSLDVIVGHVPAELNKCLLKSKVIIVLLAT